METLLSDTQLTTVSVGGEFVGELSPSSLSANTGGSLVVELSPLSLPLNVGAPALELVFPTLSFHYNFKGTNAAFTFIQWTPVTCDVQFAIQDMTPGPAQYSSWLNPSPVLAEAITTLVPGRTYRLWTKIYHDPNIPGWTETARLVYKDGSPLQWVQPSVAAEEGDIDLDYG